MRVKGCNTRKWRDMTWSENALALVDHAFGSSDHFINNARSILCVPSRLADIEDSTDNSLFQNAAAMLRVKDQTTTSEAT